MKIKIKSIFSITTIILLITAIFATSLPTAKSDVTTVASLSVTPNPVGVNQPLTILAWVQPLAINVGDLYNDFTVTITKPDGTTTTLGPKTAWPMGAAPFSYTPSVVGEYSFKFNYPGETFSDDTYLPAESPTTILTVQEERISDWPSVPLPTDYWVRATTENRDWYNVTGAWYMCYYDSTYTGYGDTGGGYNPYSEAPRAPHIMWTKPATIGGLAGGDIGTQGAYSGLSYSVFAAPPIIMNGRLFYNTNPSSAGHFRSTRYEGFAAVDLRTGEELWRNNEGGITHGQHYVSVAPGRPGVFAFLWDLNGNEWEVYDPFDGKLLFEFENTSSGTNWWWEDAVVYGEDGSLLVYILDGYAKTLTMWNSTLALEAAGRITIASDGTRGFSIRPGTLDWEGGIQWVAPTPNRDVGWHTPYSIFGINEGVIIAKSGTAGNVIDWEIAYDLETGAELWANDITVAVQSFFSSTGQGVIAAWDLTTRRWSAFDIHTGVKLWDGEQASYPWGTYASYGSLIAYDHLYSGSFDGNLYALDLDTGEIDWTYYAGDSGIETPMESWPMWQGPLSADGVLFVGGGEETPTQPLTRGNRVFAVDAETGEEIWAIAGYMSLRAIAEGYLIGYNGYDSQIYCFGKGPSATTVSAPKTEIIQGQTLVIEGTVTDQSTGAMGTPAISDEDMGPWMEYMFMEKPIPSSAKGVDVSIDVVDANGNFRNVGTATSDISGVYSLVWEPDIPGKYSVIATFAGSESYGSSFASTSFYVEEAPQPTPPPEPTPAPQTDTYVLGMGIAILAAVIILGLLILRKK